MASHAAIYRISSVGQTESSVSDAEKIEFGEGQAEPMSINVSIVKKNTNLTSPYTDNAEKPDVGIEGTIVKINIYFDENLQTAPEIEKLFNWTHDTEDTTVNFRKGRIGLRYDYRPEVNTRPTANAGYKILDFSINQVGGTKTFSIGTLTLQFLGTYSLRSKI